MKLKKKGLIFIGKTVGVTAYIFLSIFLGVLLGKYELSKELHQMDIGSNILMFFLAIFLGFLGLAIVGLLLYTIGIILHLGISAFVLAAKRAFEEDKPIPVTKVNSLSPRPMGLVEVEATLPKQLITPKPDPIVIKNRYQILKKNG